jgi:hypothetical protein
MSELLTWLALWCLPSALIFAWIWADEWLACEPEDESLSERHDAEAAANIAAFERLGRSANR